jgi:adenine-specific DNA methylase
MNYPKRLIEVDLPIKRISEHSRREKSIRHGHISTLHIWWARRPLAACRAVICAALWPDPADPLCPDSFRKIARTLMKKWATENIGLLSKESYKRFIVYQKNPDKLTNNEEVRYALLDFIADFANWDNSNQKEYLEISRALTQAAHEALGGPPGTRPLVVDPFAGGGSIPLEALRVGADTFASDLNPVSVLLNKVMLEYIPRYGQRLVDGVRKWGEWIKNEGEKELSPLYPRDSDGTKPIAYLWARTIQCEGPGCGARIPLFHSPCIAQRGKNSVWLKVKPHPRKKEIEFELSTGTNHSQELVGFLRRSAATCPLCGYTTPATNVRNQFKGRQSGAADATLLAVVTTKETQTGRKYRLPNPQDAKALNLATTELAEIRSSTPEDIPDEPLPYLRSIFNIHLLDATKWSHLYTPRQLVSLVRLIRLVKRLGKEIRSTGTEPTLADAIVTCLALAVDRVAAQFSSLSWWQPKGEFVVGTFGRQALGIIWDFAEIRPVGGASGDLDGAIDWVLRVLQTNNVSYQSEATVQIASATKHPLPDDSAAAVVTDPPYYDAVPYADLSDYFYVLLKRMLKNVHPTMFLENLTPKKGEIVQLAERNPIYSYKTKDYFEEGMRDALAEARRVTTPDGISVVVFAHKTTQGWEVMLSSIVKAGWIVTASWPIDTERAVRMRASDSAALASSVHLVCRPRENADGSVRADEVGDWRDVLAELPSRIHEWMPRLAEEGIVGADAIFACLGPALEIFSRHSRVEKASGEIVLLREYLEQVWAAVAKEALNMIFTGADASGFEEDSRLTAMWLWTLSTGNNGNGKSKSSSNAEEIDSEDESDKAKKAIGGYALEYDAARKIAQGLGAHLEKLSMVVEVKGDTARLLPVSERTRYLFGKDEASSPATKRKKKEPQLKLGFMQEIEDIETKEGWGAKSSPNAGSTVLDRLHQSMILFAAGRSEALKRFLVEEGAGNDQRFWRLAQALSALYPKSSDEKRWVDGVLARKKGLGF